MIVIEAYARVIREGKPTHLWDYSLHDKERPCDRCSRSPRPVCESCHHSLSGRVLPSKNGNEGVTACEVCGAVSIGAGWV